MCDDNHPCAIAYGCFSTTNQNTHHRMHHILDINHIPPIKAIVLLCSVRWKQTPSNKQMREFSTTIDNQGEFSIANTIVLYYTNSLELCELLYIAKQLLLSFLKVPKKNMKKTEQTHSNVGDDMSPIDDESQ